MSTHNQHAHGYTHATFTFKERLSHSGSHFILEKKRKEYMQGNFSCVTLLCVDLKGLPNFLSKYFQSVCFRLSFQSRWFKPSKTIHRQFSIQELYRILILLFLLLLYFSLSILLLSSLIFCFVLCTSIQNLSTFHTMFNCLNIFYVGGLDHILN